MTSLNPLTAARDRVHAWSVRSQLGARRNAMIASTALAARRAEREDVAEFLSAQEPHEELRPLPVAAPR